MKMLLIITLIGLAHLVRADGATNDTIRFGLAWERSDHFGMITDTLYAPNGKTGTWEQYVNERGRRWIHIECPYIYTSTNSMHWHQGYPNMRASNTVIRVDVKPIVTRSNDYWYITFKEKK